jgi:hypothetical protein
MAAPDQTPDRTTDAGEVSAETVDADERDAISAHRADRPPTEEEEAAAERNADLSPESAAAYQEAIERGANVKGEGQIDR